MCPQKANILPTFPDSFGLAQCTISFQSNMEKSFAEGSRFSCRSLMCCLFRAISDRIHGRKRKKKSSLPASVPPALVDLDVWWNLDGCPYRTRAVIRICTICRSTLSHWQICQKAQNVGYYLNPPFFFLFLHCWYSSYLVCLCSFLAITFLITELVSCQHIALLVHFSSTFTLSLFL